MIYIKKPNLPEDKVRCVIVDYRISPESIKMLNSLGIEVILSASAENLYDAVKGHPDMQLHHLGGDRFVCDKEVYEHYRRILPKDAQLQCGSQHLTGKYPDDILYNAAAVGEYLVCNKKHTAPEILNEYEKIIDVKQGYAKCATAVVNERAVLTSDTGISNALALQEFDVLLINPGEIALEGVSCGFIGGTCGLIAPDILAFNGRISRHSSADAIYDFCKKHNVNILELNNEELYDVGSIIPIY